MRPVVLVDMSVKACEGAGMDERPEQPPEGKLIADALKRTGMSIRQASRRARISYGRWRQITTGYQNVSTGSFAAVRAPAATLARMAAVVAVTPEALDAAGRPDAAESLRELKQHPVITDELDRIERALDLDLSALDPELRRALLRHYQRIDERMSELERQAERRRGA